MSIACGLQFHFEVAKSFTFFGLHGILLFSKCCNSFNCTNQKCALEINHSTAPSINPIDQSIKEMDTKKKNFVIKSIFIWQDFNNFELNLIAFVDSIALTLLNVSCVDMCLVNRLTVVSCELFRIRQPKWSQNEEKKTTRLWIGITIDGCTSMHCTIFFKTKMKGAFYILCHHNSLSRTKVAYTKLFSMNKNSLFKTTTMFASASLLF